MLGDTNTLLEYLFMYLENVYAASTELYKVTHYNKTKPSIIKIIKVITNKNT